MTKAPLAPPVREADDPEYGHYLRRATLASTVGSAPEYHDLALYGLASALIFSHLFFTNLDPAVGLVASFATFSVGFVARKLGGLSSAPSATSSTTSASERWSLDEPVRSERPGRAWSGAPAEGLVTPLPRACSKQVRGW